MLSVAIYARVSTDEQAEHGYSLSAQIENGQRRAREMGADRIAVYADPAESSMTLDRPALTAMRLAIEQKHHNCVLVWDQDRLSRDAVGALVLRDEILSAGCQLVFLQGGASTASPDDLLLYGIKALMAQSERIKIRARTMMGRRRKAEMGIMPVKFRLYGYVHDTRTGRVDVDDERAKWVRLMFQWCVDERISSWAIAKRLAALQAPSPSRKGWYRETVARLLRNEAYHGTAHVNKFDSRQGFRMRPRDEWIPITVPAIVPQALWESAQVTLRQNRERTQQFTTHPALLRGLLRCGHCGRAMRAFISPGTRHTPRYYCNPTARFQSGQDSEAVPTQPCAGSSVRMAVIDPQVWAWVGDFLGNPEQVRAFGQIQATEAQALQAEILALHHAIGQCGETRQGILGFFSARWITRSEADTQLDRVCKDEAAFRRRLCDAQTILRGASAGPDVAGRVEAVRTVLSDALSVTERAQILHEIVDHIEVWPSPDVARMPRLRIHLRVAGPGP